MVFAVMGRAFSAYFAAAFSSVIWATWAINAAITFNFFIHFFAAAHL
jgi:hypothetical protein